jgi:hypothetical protein
VNQDEAETDGQTGEAANTLLSVRRAEYGENEDEGQDNLSQQTADCGYALLTGVSACALKTGYVADQNPQQHGADESADNLEEDVHSGVLDGHTTGQVAAEGDGGVDVTAADVADGVSHSDDSQTEGQGRTDDAGGVTRCGVANRATVQADSSAATHEHEYHRANHFCKIPFHNVLMILSCLVKNYYL